MGPLREGTDDKKKQEFLEMAKMVDGRLAAGTKLSQSVDVHDQTTALYRTVLGCAPRRNVG